MVTATGSSSNLPAVRPAGELLDGRGAPPRAGRPRRRPPRARPRRLRREVPDHRSATSSPPRDQMHEPEADHGARVSHQMARSKSGSARARRSRRRPSARTARAYGGRPRTPRRRSSREPRRPAGPPFASMIASPRSSARESTAASAPRRAASARFSSVEARRDDPPAPARFASCTASVPVPPARRLDDDRLARLEAGDSGGPARARSAPGAAAPRPVVADLVGDRDQPAARGRPPSPRSRRSAAGRGDPAPVRADCRRPRRRGSAAGSARPGSRCGWRGCRRS